MGKKRIKNNQGIVTLPFLLVLVIVLFFTLSFFMLAMTLTHVTVTQYMTYSSARKLFLAERAPQRQLESAVNHYESLRSNFFKPNAYSGGTGDWFYIQQALIPGEQQYSVQGDYPESNTFRQRFYGINVKFKATVLNLKIPFLIEDGSDEIQETVRVSSFLGREPSQAECRDFHEEKAKKIKELCSNSDCPDITEPPLSTGDNGC